MTSGRAHDARCMTSGDSLGTRRGMETKTKRKLTITSSTLRDGDRIPMSMVYDGMGCAGENRSPDLRWSGAPEGTHSYVLTFHDPDAPTGVGFTHWILFDIPARVTALEASAGAGRVQGAERGRNDLGELQYVGPCPPPGDPPHHYHLRIAAIAVPALGVQEGASYALVRFALRGHVLAEGELVGLYGR
jgi:Raf kinase inhibitor-like YbhB/YbcL family protein